PVGRSLNASTDGKPKRSGTSILISIKSFIVIMKKKITKQEVLNICIQKQEEQVKNFDSRVNSIKSDVNVNDDSASQTEDRQAGTAEMLSIYQNEQVVSVADLQYLKSLSELADCSIVQPGALVITLEIVFFIAISTEKFTIDGHNVIGISVNAPIYEVMEGLSKGDSFNFNEMEYLIEEIY
ncbi:MAG: hypothetical protein ABIT58_03465, partial [Ferruginibacter sp.]